MKSVNIRLGMQCNQNCLFCTVANDHEETMSTKQAKEKILFFLKQGTKRLTITGGEPTLRRDLVAIITYARKAGMEIVDLQTNAVLLFNDSYVRKLKEAGLNYITVGFSSHKEEIYNYLTQSKFYGCALGGMKNIIKHKIALSVYHVINRENYEDLLSFIDFCLDLSKDIIFAFAFLRPNGNTLSNKHIVPKLTEIELYVYQTLNYLKSKNIYALLEGVPLCYMQEFEKQSAETWRAMQPPVPYVSEGEVKHESLHKYINKRLKKKSPVCSVCKLNNVCVGVWEEYADIYGTGELFPLFNEVEGLNG